MPIPDKRPLKVFLCHASADKPKVRELYRYLKRRGIQPWLDAEDLIPGQNWEVEIPKALETSDAILICLSKNSVDTEGYVQKEIRFALEKALEMPEGRIFLIPARLEECELPSSLKKYHWVSLYEEDGYSKLIKALKVRASQLPRVTFELPHEAEKDGTKVLEPGKDARPPALIQKTPESGEGKSPRRFSPAIIGGFLLLLCVSAVCVAVFLPQLFRGQPTAPSKTPAPKLDLPTSTIAAPSETPQPSPTPTELILPTATPFPPIIKDLFNVEMVLVPAGEFIMGRDNSSDNVSPEHKVFLDAFYIDKYEVTNIQYLNCVKEDVCKSPASISSATHLDYFGYFEFDNYPVINVDWDMARMYCESRGARLPTEAEWEKAARGENGLIFPWGNDYDGNRANFCDVNCAFDWALKMYDDKYQDAAPVGSYPGGASPYGVFDLAGNVNEWVNSLFNWYPYDEKDGREETEIPGGWPYPERVFRGGSFDGNGDAYFLYVRSWVPSFYTSDHLGFRCARDARP